MFAKRLILIAAISSWLGALGLFDGQYSASAGVKCTFSASREAVPTRQLGCRPTLLPRPGLQPDYQFYYDTPGYFPGFYPAAGMGRDLGPNLGSGFSEGPSGLR